MRNTITTLLFLFTLLAQTLAQNVGIGTTTPMAQLSVGNNSQFRVNTTGNIIRINDVQYSFPSLQSVGQQYLRNDGAGNLTWGAVSRPVVRIFSITASGITNYLIDNPADYGSGSNADPTLVLQRGFTYQFSINATGHPFTISNAPTSGVYNVGVTNNGEDNGIISFTVPMDAPSTLYYYCAIHNTSMNGTFLIQ